MTPHFTNLAKRERPTPETLVGRSCCLLIGAIYGRCPYDARVDLSLSEQGQISCVSRRPAPAAAAIAWASVAPLPEVTIAPLPGSTITNS